MEFLNKKKLTIASPVTLSLNGLKFVESNNAYDKNNFNTSAFASPQSILKNAACLKTSANIKKLFDKFDKASVCDFLTKKHSSDYGNSKNVISTDKIINWRRTGNFVAVFLNAKMSPMQFLIHNNKPGALSSSPSISQQSISTTKIKNKSKQGTNLLITSHAGTKKQAGRQKTIKRVGVKMHFDKFGQEIHALEGSWLFEQFRLAALKDSWETQNLVSKLTEVMLKSLKSLYIDGIKPWLGDVAHRLRPSFQHLLTLAEVKALAEMCQEKVQLVHETRCKGEKGCVVYLTHKPDGYRGFVDIHNTDDPFTQHQWQLFYSHMISLMQYDAVTTKDKPYEFRGGRYAFAELMQRSVEEFKNKRLGELCHMVQLSIHNGALTYVNCVLQPSSACYSKTRAITKIMDTPIETKHPICQSIEEVMQIAMLLTDHHPEGLVLAQLKQKFQREFNRDLDPEVFGYMKLQHLFLHRPLSSTYRLYTPRNSQHRTIVQHIQYPLPEGAVLFKTDSVKETKLDQILATMSPISYFSNVSSDFLKQGSVWSFKIDVDEISWNKFFATNLDKGESWHDSSSYFNSYPNLQKKKLSSPHEYSSITHLPENIEKKQSLNQEDRDKRFLDDAASLDDFRSVTSSATTDASSVTPTNYPAFFSPNNCKCVEQLPHNDSFLEIFV